MKTLNKEGLKAEIYKIPRFVLRDVAVKDSCVNEPNADGTPAGLSTWWEEQPGDKAVTEENSTRRIAYMTKRYKLVQFADGFLIPIVDQFEGEVVGEVHYHEGYAIMDLFPVKDEYKTDDGCRIGVTAYNSVDRTSALNIRFCVEDANGRTLTIPKRIASFRKLHVGKIGELTTDYITLLGRVQAAWKNIVEKFTKYKVTPEEFDSIVKQFDLDETATKKMREIVMNGGVANLWDFCMETFDMIEKRYYKSDVHKRRRMDDLCNTIFTYNVVMQLAPSPAPDGTA